jgi:GNAT superfamily N-acetyltransferase
MKPVVTPVDPADAGIVVDVLWDAFHDYPAMHHVLGSEGDYDGRLRTLIDYFVASRALLNDPMLAVRDGDVVAAVATMTLPGRRLAPRALVRKHKETWAELGDDERARDDAFNAAARKLLPGERHHHLNMLGVRQSCAGRGFARILLDAVHAIAESDPASMGVTLSTEKPENVPFYRHFGYRLLGHVRVADDLETWVFFRPRAG